MFFLSWEKRTSQRKKPVHAQREADFDYFCAGNMFGITRNKYFVGSVINLGKADGVRDKTRLPSQGRFCNLQMSKGIIPCFSPLVQAEWKQIGVNSAPQIV